MTVSKNEKHLYLQLKEKLKLRITSGEIKAGERIPPIRELCKFYGVSDITVRKAIQTLLDENILQTEHGRGTFVKGVDSRSNRKLNYWFPFTSISNDIGGSVILNAIQRAALTHHFTISLSDYNQQIRPSDQDFTHLNDILRLIINCTFRDFENSTLIEGIKYLIKKGVPVISLDNVISSLPIHYIGFGHEQSAYEVCRYMISLGLKKIFLIGFINFQKGNMRLQGYKKALTEAGIKIENFWITPIVPGVERKRIHSILNDVLKMKPDAIYIPNPSHSIEIMIELKKLGLKLNSDIITAATVEENYTQLIEHNFIACVKPMSLIADQCMRAFISLMKDNSKTVLSKKIPYYIDLPDGFKKNGIPPLMSTKPTIETSYPGDQSFIFEEDM